MGNSGSEPGYGEPGDSEPGDSGQGGSGPRDSGPGQLRLRPPVHRVHRTAVTWWRARILLAGAAAVAVPAVTALLLPDVVRPWLVVPAVGLAVVTVVAAVGMPPWWYRVHRWEVTGDAVYTRTGALWQEWRVAPMSRIQTVDSDRGPLEQFFGLATVTVTTASARGALRIPGLDHALAAELVHELTETTQATPGDAT